MAEEFGRSLPRLEARDSVFDSRSSNAPKLSWEVSEQTLQAVREIERQARIPEVSMGFALLD